MNEFKLTILRLEFNSLNHWAMEYPKFGRQRGHLNEYMCRMKVLLCLSLAETAKEFWARSYMEGHFLTKIT